ncbi:type II CAAX endopeptidase family protein [Chengkuizengella axinellae]|uniref:Type II CAAX endopeptidase family protein n=1 Tax=Chengkuizengella axinellae TaxID=3064388 RepID=A0ABT9IWN5_9BACL|nr:type II CAAX endopeptidase family protein [Chengkuizengella sp. 2205SS18-9]MDP5273766.1 type II CAAX endopeptidase family protein [Chengkuizengella sp. 2205SS18-9]
MKKNKLKIKLQFKKVNLDKMSDKLLLYNLYFTQLFTLLIGLIIIFFQGRNVLEVLSLPTSYAQALIWGVGFAIAVLVFDLLISRWVPEDVSDDGGINERIFKNRPLWHIFVISLVVAICEELLFRGAIQHVFGPYWTSILFAAIHIRYLQHWLMTGLVFSISYGLGWIYIQTETLWVPIIAHFLIDFIMGTIIKYKKD